MLERPSKALRATQVACAVFFCLTTSGVIFGFAGVYHGLCGEELDGNFETPCIEQDLRLNFMFTLATVVTNTFALPVGILLDHVGPKYTSILGAIVFALGSFLFGLGHVSPSFDSYFCGFIALAIGGPLIFLSSFHLSNVFPRHSGLVLSLITGAFDCSSFSYLIYNALDKSHNISIQTFFWAYLIVPALVIVQQLTIAPNSSYKLGSFGDDASEAVFASETHENGADGNSSITARPPHSRANTSFSTRNSISSGARTIRPRFISQSEDPLQGAMAGRSVIEQLRSSYFVLMAIFLCVYMCRINYYIQTVSSQLVFYLNDPNLAGRISTAFTVLLPLGGVIGIPIIGLVLDRLGSGAAALIVLLSGVIFGLLGITPYAPAQIISIGVFVILRPLMYTFMGDYTGKAFGFETFGRVYGLLNCIAGFFGLVLRPIDLLTKGPLHGNYTVVNVVGIICGVLMASGVAWRIYHRPAGRIALP